MSKALERPRYRSEEAGEDSQRGRRRRTQGGQKGAQPALFLKAAGFPCQEQTRDAEWPPDSPTLLGLQLVGQQSLSEIFLLLKEKNKTKTQNTRKPKSDLVQALEHLWH